MPLRVCRSCGKQVSTEQELELFARANASKYGRKQLCKVCSANNQKEFRERHPNYQDRYRDKSIFYKKHGIVSKTIVRTNVCSICGKKYPEELKRRTTLHHFEYDDEHPFANTIEVCKGCHNKLHFKGKHRVDPEIQRLNDKAWRNRPDVKARLRASYKIWVEKKKLENPEWWEKRKKGLPTGNSKGRPRKALN